MVPANKRQYPRLKGEDRTWLCKLFKEACVAVEGSYVDWVRLATAATQDLYNTTWSFKHTMQSMVSRVKWAHETPINQWAENVKRGTGAGGAVGTEPDQAGTPQYTTYMFNPAVFPKTEIVSLRKLCERPPAAPSGRGLREGTKDKWKIITGMVEGTILCRKAPGFLKSVLDSKERIRLYGTIQKQVEGELILQLREWVTVKPSRQATRALKDDILLAAEEHGVSSNDLRQLMHLVKTISYDHTKRSIHSTLSTEQRPVGSRTPKFRSSEPFTGFGTRISRIQDRYGPGNWATMVYGRTRSESHWCLNIQQLEQCLQCGNVGHTMVRCRYTAEQLKGEGSRVASDTEVTKLEDMARPFASLSEFKKAAETRLSVHQAHQNKAREAVAPPAPDLGSLDSQRVSGSTSGLYPVGPAASDNRKSQPPVPQPQKKWATAPLSRGRTLYAHPAALAEKRFAVFEEEDEDEGDQEEKREAPSAQAAVEISSNEESESPKPRTLTPKERAQLRLVKAKPPKLIKSPQLVALKQREREEMETLTDSMSPFKGSPLPSSGDAIQAVTSFSEIEALLGLRQVATPATGNCMVLALAQAIVDHDLAAHGRVLEQLALTLKRGIKWSALLNNAEQYDHFTRTNTLVNVGRGWNGMDSKESSKQFRWYLEEFANSSSQRDELLPREVWGSS
ncbi:hypothetical protein PInf_022846 [Phytophthora infestans]|nr:hypothetical protein PInf_022846 [Phytophthora infestans]